jgi:hypothetical protein
MIAGVMAPEIRAKRGAGGVVDLDMHVCSKHHNFLTRKTFNDPSLALATAESFSATGEAVTGMPRFRDRPSGCEQMEHFRCESVGVPAGSWGCLVGNVGYRVRRISKSENT